ncbi:MAG TPA: response regulator, partial [Thermosynechococcaceae cyanobacterium]
QQKGAIVSTEASAQAALTAIQATHFDLLISDIGLPNIDGYSFLRQVRALPVEPRAQIPAMAVTGFADEQTRLQILAAGFQRALAKPTDIDQFVSIVADLAGRSQCVTQHYSQK